MWFLTQEGVDRYDGKYIKHYNFSDDSIKLDSRIALNWLYMDSGNILWVIGQKGRIFRYDSQHDKFKLAYIHPELIRNKPQAFLNYGYLDKSDRIWLCYKDSITWYDIRTGTTLHMPTPVNGEITAIEQTDDNHFFIGTGSGLFHARIEKGKLNIMPDKMMEGIGTSVHELYYHAVSKQLFVGNYKEGILIYDVGKTGKVIPCQSPNNVEINRIVALNAHELLVATGGKGVYKLDMNTCMSEPYITADYNSYNGMNGNNINDIYVDEEERIWLANYPTGITVRNNRYGSYDLIRHSLGNSLSLVNDQVHDVLEDSDGDLWFATSNGISLYQTDTKEWRSFLSSFDPVPDDENHIFLALCEASPGVIWAGGFMSGICKIEKRKGFKISHLSPAAIAGVRPDQYIFDIKKDSGGDIWSGGYHHLKRINLETKSVRLYPGVNSITTIQEKDTRQMWIGTRMGLYQLDKESGVYQYVDLPIESPYICALYQRNDGILYIGTRGAGLLVYDINKKKFIHQYRTDNCALISDNIYTILPRQDESLLMGTENGITIYSPREHSFRNWTREQGLMSVNFNTGSATTYSKNTLVFGGNDGAVRFPIDIQIPEPHYSRLLLRDFMIAYHPVYPGDDGSALLPGGEGRVEAAHAAADDQYVRLMTMGLHRNGSLFLEVVQEGADTARALGAVFRAGGVGNADMAFAGRAEVVAGHAGHKLLLKEALAERHRVEACVAVVDEQVERAFWVVETDVRRAGQPFDEDLAAFLKGLAHGFHAFLRAVEGFGPAVLGEGGHAEHVVLLEAGQALDEFRRASHVAEPPAGHGIGFG